MPYLEIFRKISINCLGPSRVVFDLEVGAAHSEAQPADLQARQHISTTPPVFTTPIMRYSESQTFP